MQFVDFLKRHNLTQVEFASWFGRKKGAIWRYTKPPGEKDHRPVPAEMEAFCLAYETMPPKMRADVVKRLKALFADRLSGGAGVRLKDKGEPS